MPTSDDKIKVWRLRAEEYRTAADNAKYEDAKQVYRTLARNYEHLADREERKLDREQPKKTGALRYRF